MGHTLLTDEQVRALVAAYREGVTIAELRERFGIGKNSLYRHLQRAASRRTGDDSSADLIRQP